MNDGWFESAATRVGPENTRAEYNPLAWFVGEPVIGEGTWIGPFCLIDGSGGLVIGRGCDVSAGVQIYTHSSARRCVTNRGEDIDRAPVAIGDNTFIGANAVVLMGVAIGSRCVIGAGAVVTSDVPDGAVVVGVPARVVGVVDPATGACVFHSEPGPQDQDSLEGASGFDL
jgi:acetyltransferase-like isoleucine patch superfamily enzyme